MRTNLRLLPLLFLAITVQLHAADTEAPVITSIAVPPDPVEVSSGPQSITVTLHITDDEDGFEQGFLYLRDSGDRFIDSTGFGPGDLTSGTVQSGTYEVAVEVPGYGTPGPWYFEAYVRDGTFKSRTYGDDPGDDAFPVPADATFAVTNTDPPDTAAPVASNIVFSPLSVSTATGPATITVNFDAVDTPSGFQRAYIYIQDPNGDYQYDNLIEINASDRQSGDEFSGSYQGTTIVPQGSLTGTWKVELLVYDKLGNHSFSPQTAIDVTGPAGTLATALDAVQYTWTTNTPGWKHQSLVTNDGVDAAASLPIGDDEQATFQTTVTGPGTLSFHWKVSSEEDFDYLSVDAPGTVDDQEISGDVDWEEVVLSIPSGQHTVVWSYAKDSSGMDGDDRAWVDQIRFIADVDNELPVLQSVRISPNFVDLSQGGESVTVTIEASDDLNGIHGVYVDLMDPSGNSYESQYLDGSSPEFGDSNYGTYEAIFELIDYGEGEYFEPGIWRVEVTLEEDVTGSTVSYGPSYDPFPVPGEEFLTVSEFGGGGGEAPLVEEISVSPGTVDVSSGPDTFVVTLRITDPEEGFSDGNVILDGPSGQRLNHYFSSGNPQSGDEYDGIYEVTVTVPLYAEPGPWTLGLQLTDNSGNSREYPYDPPYSLPGDDSVTVLNSSGSADTLPPTIASFEVSSNAVDPSGSPVPVTVDVTITDDLSGLGDGYFYLYDPSGDYLSGSLVSLTAANRISGDAINGTYQFDLTFPAGAANGVWTIRSFMRDNAGNSDLYGFSGPPIPGPGNAQVTVGPVSPSTFDNFTSTYGLTGPDALPGADPDRDLFINALELLLGLNPTIPDPADPLVYEVSHTATHLELLFTIDSSLTVATNGDFLEVSDATGTPFSVTGQTGADLMNWTDQLPTNVGGSTYRVSLPIASGPNGHVRLGFATP